MAQYLKTILITACMITVAISIPSRSDLDKTNMKQELRSTTSEPCDNGETYYQEYEKCDNLRKCSDGADELNCKEYHCFYEEWRTVNSTQICDETFDCPDGYYDEYHCGGCSSSSCYNGGTCTQYHLHGHLRFECTCPQTYGGSRCEYGWNGCEGYPCFNGGSCVTDDDGHICLCPGLYQSPHCEDYCDNETAVYSDLDKCNIFKDCKDGSDELNCEEYHCHNDPSIKLDSAQICDGNVDCPDGKYDEYYCTDNIQTTQSTDTSAITFDGCTCTCQNIDHTDVLDKKLFTDKVMNGLMKQRPKKPKPAISRKSEAIRKMLNLLSVKSRKPQN